MTADKFKVGDKVIVVEPEHGNAITVGSYGVVIEIIAGRTYDILVQYKHIPDIRHEHDNHKHLYKTRNSRLRLNEISNWKQEVSK